MSNIKVSVIIAAYNIKDYIERCLKSVLSQSLKEIEVIVVNDGSSDGTELEVKKMIDRGYKIILLNQENSGPIEARKKGLRCSKGEYFLFVDGDDWLEPNALEPLYNNAKFNKSDIVLYNALRVCGDRKEKIRKFSSDLSGNLLKDFLTDKIGHELWFKFIKRKYFLNQNIQFPSNIRVGENLVTT